MKLDERMPMMALVAQYQRALAPAPEKARPKKPTIEEMETEIERLQMEFAGRDEFIRMLRSIARLSTQLAYTKHARRTHDAEDDLIVILSMADTIIQELKRRISGQRWTVHVAAEDPSREAKQTADDIEELCRHLHNRNERRMRRGGSSDSLMGLRAHYLAEDGQVYERKRFVEDDPTTPVHWTLYDPVQCFPLFRDQQLVRFYRVYQTTIDDLRQEYPAAAGRLRNMDGDDTIQVNVVYTTAYHGVWSQNVEGLWIKPLTAHDYGEVPVTIHYVNGYPTAADSSVNALSDDLKTYQGRGILASVASELQMVAQLVTDLLTMTAKAADPPVIVQHPAEGEQAIGGLGPGETMQARGQWDAKVLVGPSGALNYVKETLDFLLTNIRTATLTLGDSGIDGDPSGNAFMQRMQAARAVINPYFETLESHAAAVFECSLRMIRDLADPVPVISDSTNLRVKREIDPMLIGDDPIVTVRFDRFTDQERKQLLVIMAQVVANDGFSLQSMFEELGYEDAEEQVRRIQMEKAWRDPKAYAILAPVNQFALLKARIQYEEEAGNFDAAAVAHVQLMQLLQQVNRQSSMPEMPPGMPPDMAMQLAQMAEGPGQPGPSPLLGPGGPGGMPPQDPFSPPTGLPPAAMPPEQATAGLMQMGPVPVPAGSPFGGM